MIRSENEDPNVPPSPELEKFSDIEDAELNKYILSTKERRFKTALWKLINRDYHEVATAVQEQTKASGKKPRYTEKSGKEKKRKRGRDGYVPNQGQGQGLTNKVVEQDAKKNNIESSVANDHEISNDAMDNWTGEEFIFNEDEV